MRCWRRSVDSECWITYAKNETFSQHWYWFLIRSRNWECNSVLYQCCSSSCSLTFYFTCNIFSIFGCKLLDLNQPLTTNLLLIVHVSSHLFLDLIQSLWTYNSYNRYFDFSIICNNILPPWIAAITLNYDILPSRSVFFAIYYSSSEGSVWWLFYYLSNLPTCIDLIMLL